MGGVTSSAWVGEALVGGVSAWVGEAMVGRVTVLLPAILTCSGSGLTVPVLESWTILSLSTTYTDKEKSFHKMYSMQ